MSSPAIKEYEDNLHILSMRSTTPEEREKAALNIKFSIDNNEGKGVDKYALKHLNFYVKFFRRLYDRSDGDKTLAQAIFQIVWRLTQVRDSSKPILEAKVPQLCLDLVEQASYKLKVFTIVFFMLEHSNMGKELVELGFIPLLLKNADVVETFITDSENRGFLLKPRKFVYFALKYFASDKRFVPNLIADGAVEIIKKTCFQGPMFQPKGLNEVQKKEVEDDADGIVRISLDILFYLVEGLKSFRAEGINLVEIDIKKQESKEERVEVNVDSPRSEYLSKAVDLDISKVGLSGEPSAEKSTSTNLVPTASKRIPPLAEIISSNQEVTSSKKQTDKVKYLMLDQANKLILDLKRNKFFIEFVRQAENKITDSALTALSCVDVLAPFAHLLVEDDEVLFSINTLCRVATEYSNLRRELALKGLHRFWTIKHKRDLFLNTNVFSMSASIGLDLRNVGDDVVQSMTSFMLKLSERPKLANFIACETDWPMIMVYILEKSKKTFEIKSEGSTKLFFKAKKRISRALTSRNVAIPTNFSWDVSELLQTRAGKILFTFFNLSLFSQNLAPAFIETGAIVSLKKLTENDQHPLVAIIAKLILCNALGYSEANTYNEALIPVLSRSDVNRYLNLLREGPPISSISTFNRTSIAVSLVNAFGSLRNRKVFRMENAALLCIDLLSQVCSNNLHGTTSDAALVRAYTSLITEFLKDGNMFSRVSSNPETVAKLRESLEVVEKLVSETSSVQLQGEQVEETPLSLILPAETAFLQSLDDIYYQLDVHN
eukprot:augustus_masked-scaffold_14-processed-gene-6.6-mRNA-1 protein AED:1.00 eAED:1.00 QI:0/-1/0/0/-1/1/1/0/774